MKECVTLAGPNNQTKQFISEEKATIAIEPHGEGSSFDKIMILKGDSLPKSTKSCE